jgi:hypothetical protein
VTGFRVGDVVKVQRDEIRYPPRGTWPRFKGRVGIVVTADNYGEVGVSFKAGAEKWRQRMHADAWFGPHELVAATRQQLAAQADA